MSEIRRLNRERLAIIAQASKDDHRPALEVLCVEPDGTCVVTDGFAMIAVGPCLDAAGEGRMILRRELVEAALAEEHDLSFHPECFELAGKDDKHTLSFGPMSHTYSANQHAFPEWKRLVVSRLGRNDALRIRFDPRRLRELMETLESIVGQVGASVDLIVSANPEEPMLFTAQTINCEPVIAALMPMLLRDDPARKWAKALVAEATAAAMEESHG